MCSAVVAEARRYWSLAEDEDPHVFEVGQVVFLADCRVPSPFCVVRIGYGDYRHQLRIRRWDEPDRWEAGHWRHFSELVPLDIGGGICPSRDVVVATTDEHVIPAGSPCIFGGFDDSNDILMTCSGRQRIIFSEDFVHFEPTTPAMSQFSGEGRRGHCENSRGIHRGH